MRRGNTLLPGASIAQLTVRRWKSLPEVSRTSSRVIYVSYAVVVGVVGHLSLFAPQVAFRSVFEGTIQSSLDTKMLGGLWLTIAIVTAFGLFRALPFSPVLLVQILYKEGWLRAVAAPFLFAGRADALPASMSIFFAVWILVLPFAIPWRYLFAA